MVVRDDPFLLALELSAPAVLLVAKEDRQPQCTEEALESMEKHIWHFCDTFMKG